MRLHRIHLSVETTTTTPTTISTTPTPTPTTISHSAPTMAASEALVVSAPGKVLLAGGYLVLDPAYPGVVVATQARFYSAAREATPGQRPDILVRSPQFIDADWGFYIQLVEPSSDAEASAPAVHLVQTAESFRQAGPNPFVALALLTAHRLALDSLGLPAYRDRVRSGKTELVIVGDNDFYSHRSSPQSTATTPMTQSQSPSEQASPVPAKIPAPTAAELAKLPAFAPLGVSLRDVHKTGLGSSAAMTTSVVGALLARLGLVGTTGALTASDRALVHNTAQLAHCSAQGKIGSGFDVSSATWGSQLFRRFCPDVLAPVLLEKNAVQVEPSSSPQPEQQERGSPSATEPEPVRNPQADTISLPPGLLRDTLSAQNRNWVPPSSTASMGGVGTAVEGLAKLGGTVRETASASTSAPGVDASHLEEKVAHQPALTQLPPRIELVLADVDAGSNTPSLVSRVLAWRKAQPAWAAQIYTVLNASNQSLADTLLALTLEALKDQGRYDRALDLLAEIKSSEVRSSYLATFASHAKYSSPFETSKTELTPPHIRFQANFLPLRPAKEHVYGMTLH